MHLHRQMASLTATFRERYGEIPHLAPDRPRTAHWNTGSHTWIANAATITTTHLPPSSPYHHATKYRSETQTRATPSARLAGCVACGGEAPARGGQPHQPVKRGSALRHSHNEKGPTPKSDSKCRYTTKSVRPQRSRR